MGLPLVPANALEISSYRGEAGLGLASLAEPPLTPCQILSRDRVTSIVCRTACLLNTLENKVIFYHQSRPLYDGKFRTPFYRLSIRSRTRGCVPDQVPCHGSPSLPFLGPKYRFRNAGSGSERTRFVDPIPTAISQGGLLVMVVRGDIVSGLTA